MVQRVSEKISELDQRTAPSSSAIVPVVDGDTTYRVLKQDLVGFLNVRDYGVSTTSTDNVAAINSAIAAAQAASASLYWPAGTYVILGTTTNLHTVKHRGPGVIQRGSDVFTLEASSSTTNRLYISPTGSASNDGLHNAQPMLLPQNAFNALKNYGPVLEGTWRIVCSGGTWNGTVHRNEHVVPSKNPVIFEGPSVGGHPNVPTAIFDGTTGSVASDWAIRANGSGVQIDLRDVKAQDYSFTGFLFDYGAVVYFDNIHGSGNTYSDTYFQGCKTIRGGGGIWESPRGSLVNGCVDVTLGYGATPIRCNGCVTSGIEWSRGSEGHVDYVEFNDCAVGLDVLHNSRAHVMGCNFKRSTTSAVRARSAGSYYDDLATPNTFNEGTADDNAVKFLNLAFSGESDEDLWLSHSARRRAFDKNSYTLTGTTTLTAMSTLLSGAVNSRIPAYWFEDNTKKILVRVTGRFVTASALSAIGVSLGGVEIDRITLTGGGPAANSVFYYECEIEAVGPNSQFKKSRLIVDGMNPRLQQNSPTVTTSADLALTVNGKLANGGDSMNVFWTEAWLVG